MNKYEKELQILKPQDEVQGVYEMDGYMFLSTGGHGYLVVPKEDKNYGLACRVYEYGYMGNLAVYLEEDCEAPEFLNKVKVEVTA